jgi:hypothetical protein
LQANAGSAGGCRGNKAPNFGAPNFLLARHVTITADSWWRVRSNGDQIFADGTGPGATGAPGGPTLLPSAPPWSLVAQFIARNPRGNEEAISGLFYIGRGGTFQVPPFAPNSVGPDGYSYQPGVYVNYFCNDEPGGFFDNDGYLHIRENWTT